MSVHQKQAKWVRQPSNERAESMERQSGTHSCKAFPACPRRSATRRSTGRARAASSGPPGPGPGPGPAAGTREGARGASRSRAAGSPPCERQRCTCATHTITTTTTTISVPIVNPTRSPIRDQHANQTHDAVSTRCTSERFSLRMSSCVRSDLSSLTPSASSLKMRQECEDDGSAAKLASSTMSNWKAASTRAWSRRAQLD